MMARPQTDIEAGRRLLLETAEGIIRDRGAVDIAISELASVAGMSPSNIYRFFESKEDLFEAIAERWFADKISIMETVIASSMSARDKMHAFFGRRFALMVADYETDPELFQSYCELGSQHFETVRGYVDLADHYLALIVAEAMQDGYFSKLTIDQTVSLINLMIQPFCNPDLIIHIGVRPTDDKLSEIIDTIFTGLGRAIERDNVIPMLSVA
jgi:TetR/AcrR family transcriptional regulator, repressor of the ameABC operon